IQALLARAQENFPVASLLFPAHARKPLLHFYAFARHSDNIADAAEIPPDEKQAQLTLLDAALANRPLDAPLPEWFRPYLADTQSGISPPAYGRDLLKAFLQDASQQRYADWDALLAYCNHSAVPVGRQVLELCAEKQADLTAADALCIVLQLLNHLQDCKADYEALNRIYLPQTLFKTHEAKEADLRNPHATPALQRLFSDYLDRCEALLDTASPLPTSIKSRRLRWELTLTLELARALLYRLRRNDPLSGPVRVPRFLWPVYLLKAGLHTWLPPQTSPKP
ncbi:MAG: squalene/phytoene synthase family protein, partial [Rickettsiales bacterium]